MIDNVDLFVGTGITDLPPPSGLAATWWWPKPQVGNTHPGAVSPFGMVSACAYSGAYPTGYGTFDLSTEGVPTSIHDTLTASGFTHFQQSGTGAIRKYYNYFRVTPMLDPLEHLGTRWRLRDEIAEPGYYAATLESGIRCELTVGPKSAIHRYTFPEHADARIVIDCSLGGLDIAHGRTVPLRAWLSPQAPGVARGEVVMEGAPVAVHIEHDAVGWRQMLWYDHRLMPGSTRLEFDYIRPTTLRPFGMLIRGPSEPGETVEVRIGFSLRGADQAERNLRFDTSSPIPSADHGPSTSADAFDQRRERTRRDWRHELGRIRVEGAPSERQKIFATALYHSMIKPSFAPDESPSWPTPGPFVFDICTMWDIYRTQLPLIATLDPARAGQLATALLRVCEEEGNLPIGYRMAKGADRFSRQGSALAHTFLADLCDVGAVGIDWEWALVHMHGDLRRDYGEEFLERGIVHPISHTLDLAMGYHCTAKLARRLEDPALADSLDALAARWTSAFDPETGLLVDSTFYEGGRWNYSFRLMHDMATRIALAGGEQRFVALLDQFFGYGAAPVKQLGRDATTDELVAGYALNRFEGLNNEPDMDAPWAYHYAGRPDRTAEVVHAIINNQFGTGPGGLPGNDDSGGLSSWYVWASMGLFPVAGQGIFLVNAPSFRSTRIQLTGTTFTIDTTGFVEPEPDLPPQYVQAARLDGRPLERTWITIGELHAGGRLELDLGPTPGDWGWSTRPPSVSTDRHEPLGAPS